MTTDIMKVLIDFFQLILERATITRFLDALADIIDTAVTFLPRLGIVLGYVSYFVDWILLVPLLVIVLLSFTVRVVLAAYNAIAQIIP